MNEPAATAAAGATDRHPPPRPAVKDSLTVLRLRAISPRRRSQPKSARLTLSLSHGESSECERDSEESALLNQ